MNETVMSYEKAAADQQPPEGHVDKRTLARLLNRGVRTIEAWMSLGRIPYYKTGKRVSFLYSEVKSALRTTWHVEEKSKEVAK